MKREEDIEKIRNFDFKSSISNKIFEVFPSFSNKKEENIGLIHQNNTKFEELWF